MRCEVPAVISSVSSPSPHGGGIQLFLTIIKTCRHVEVLGLQRGGDVEEEGGGWEESSERRDRSCAGVHLQSDIQDNRPPQTGHSQLYVWATSHSGWTRPSLQNWHQKKGYILLSGNNAIPSWFFCVDNDSEKTLYIIPATLTFTV